MLLDQEMLDREAALDVGGEEAENKNPSPRKKGGESKTEKCMIWKVQSMVQENYDPYVVPEELQTATVVTKKKQGNQLEEKLTWQNQPG